MDLGRRRIDGIDDSEKVGGRVESVDDRLNEVATEVAVLDNRMKVSEHRMAQVEKDIRSLRTHMDRNQAVIGALVIIIPISLHFLG
jgi:peptidoglycan hydrolase CwlO-like protein